MESSPWRQPYLVDLTYGEIYNLVDAFAPNRQQRIIDLGCGSGFLSLELARAGHDVLGIDVDAEALRRARYVRDNDPFKSKRGSLEYKCADFSSWKDRGSFYDLAIFSRALHHMAQPANALAKARDLLSPRGRVICIEYAYDRFKRQSATWFYHIRTILEQAGWFSSRKRLSTNSREPVSKILKEWRAHGRKEHLNRFEEMYKPLRKLFRQHHFSWEPYIFWDIIMGMRIPSHETENVIARSVKAMEEALIDKKAISPILFCFVGDR